jgi:hypothetical protein
MAAGLAMIAAGAWWAPAHASSAPGLWRVYDDVLSRARYIDLTHDITPNMPVWKGFGPAAFAASVDPATGMPYTYAHDGFEATAYQLSTDQFGTQLDPPARPPGSESPNEHGAQSAALNGEEQSPPNRR